MAEVLASAGGDGRPWMRVAVVSMHTSPTAALGHSANGGLNVYVRRVCEALASRGVATDVFTRSLDGDRPTVEAMGPLSRVVNLPAGPPDLDKYSLVDRVPEFGDGIADFVEASGLEYDLLYSHYWLSGLAACRLHRPLDLPWAHTAHTLAVVKNRRLAPGDRPEPELRADLEGEISRCADLLVASTSAEADEIRQAYHVPPDRVAVVPPGVDLHAFQPGDREHSKRRLGQQGRRLLLFVGRLERLKGVEVAIRAMALVAPAHPSARLLVVGDDSIHQGESERARLERMVDHLGMRDHVEFVGRVDQNRLGDYYAAAEACVMPSYSESFGLVGLEAQACGSAVIASDVAGLASVVRDGVTGYLVPDHDPQTWALRFDRLLSDPGLCHQMGRRGVLLAQRFSWERTADRLLSEFEELSRPLAEASRRWV